jgi:hypothetical protein
LTVAQRNYYGNYYDENGNGFYFYFYF